MKKHVLAFPKLVFVLSIMLVVFGCGEDKEAPAVTDESTDELEENTIITGNDGGPMALIPAGAFQMGDAFNEGTIDELPVHTVYLDAFYIDVYEVTNAQYTRFLNEYGKDTDAAGHILLDIDSDWCLIENVGNTYKPKSGYENHPAVIVSWYGAAAYAQFYGERLPTEAEWEKAARGGSASKRYVWGNDWPPPKGTGNFADETARRVLDWDWGIEGYDDGYAETAPVGSFSPNAFGLYDIAGNVCEWCADEYREDYYSVSPENNPKGPGVPVTFTNDDFTNIEEWHNRVLRGGSFFDNHGGISPLRVAARSIDDPAYPYEADGFRCVRSKATP